MNYDPVDFDDIHANRDYQYFFASEATSPDKFDNLINRIYRYETTDAPEDILDSYINEGGNLTDYIMFEDMSYIDTCISIPVAIVQSGNFALLEKLLQLDPTMINYHDNEYSLLAHAIKAGQYEMAYYLLELGADPNQPGRRLKTPLYQAIQSENPALVQQMLERNADPNLCYSVALTNYLSFALDNYASKNTVNSKTIVQLLIQANAEFQIDKLNNTTKQLYYDIVNEMS